MSVPFSFVPRRPDSGLVVIAFCLFILGTSCGRPRAATPPGGESTEGDRIPFTLLEDVTLTAPGTIDFLTVTDVVPIGLTSIAALDNGQQKVFVFDLASGSSRSFGGPGQGPGYLSPAATRLIPLAGGRLLIPDAGAGRVQVFDDEGNLVAAHTLDLVAGLPTAWSTRSFGDQNIVAMSSRQFPGVTAAGGFPSTSVDKMALHRVDLNQWKVLDSTTLDDRESLDLATGTIMLFASAPVWDMVDSTRIAVGDGASYRITVMNWREEVVHVIERNLPRQPLSDREQNELRSLFLQKMAASGAPPAMLDQLKSQIRVANHYPFFTRVMADDQGNLFVQRPATVQELVDNSVPDLTRRNLGGGTWDVFDNAGAFQGSVETPPGFRTTAVRSGYLYGYRETREGEVTVVRLRMVARHATP